MHHSDESPGRPNNLLEEAAHLLRKAEAPSVPDADAVVYLDQAVLRLRLVAKQGGRQPRLMLARANFLRGEALRRLNRGGSSPASIEAYGNAAKLLRELPPGDAPGESQALAELCTRCGLALLEDSGAPRCDAALGCFDQAIGFLKLSAQGSLSHRYQLIGAWLNRGQALACFKDAAQLPEILKSLDEAFALFAGLPAPLDPRFLQRLAMLHVNRGSALMERGEAGDLKSAVRAFDEALAVLGRLRVGEDPDLNTLIASAWANRANALGRLDVSGNAPEIRLSCERAMALVVATESEHPAAAEAGLKARHSLCRAIAAQLLSSNGAEAREKQLNEAARVAEEGIVLSRSWTGKKAADFRSLYVDFLNFGYALHEHFCPHLLGAFLIRHHESAQTLSRSLPWDARQRLEQVIPRS